TPCARRSCVTSTVISRSPATARGRRGVRASWNYAGASPRRWEGPMAQPKMVPGYGATPKDQAGFAYLAELSRRPEGLALGHAPVAIQGWQRGWEDCEKQHTTLTDLVVEMADALTNNLTGSGAPDYVDLEVVSVRAWLAKVAAVMVRC